MRDITADRPAPGIAGPEHGAAGGRVAGDGTAVRSHPHDSAVLHVTGRANYIEDLPRLEGELAIAFCGAPCARGRLRSVDTAEAAGVSGVVGVYTWRDVPGASHWGPIVEDEPFLVKDEIRYLGQPVAVVAAEEASTAAAAAAAVRIEVEEETPVLSIEEADGRGEYLGPERAIRRGDVEAALRGGEHRIEGVVETKGQEQFYLENQAALCQPGEEDDLLIHSSTQNPTEIQKVVAEVLGLGQHQVVCVVKRMGGAFGGKETQAALPALMTALVARATGRPARLVYDKDTDMRVTGKRHAFRTEYRVAFDDAGVITGARFRLRSDGGAYADLSTAVLERAMLHVDNAYFLENVEITARVCRTDLPPNTAFRGFGGPQGMAVIERVMEEIAERLGVDALDVRRANLYSAGGASGGSSGRDVTPYGQVVEDNLLPEIFDRLERSSDYRRRRSEISAFNADSRTHLRGLAMVPVKFGISFTNKSLNQANALVNVYTDGTVQVSTGATEMGQGVNVKIAQIVAEELGIGFRNVVVMPTSTEKNNNTSPTAASASTDLNGTAAVRACDQIRERMAGLFARLFPETRAGDVGFGNDHVYDGEHPEVRLPFAELAARAHLERVDLGARGFYATPDIDFDRETGRGTPFYYFTTGCAVAEVLVDRFVGELAIERLDVLMDIGKPINFEVERGQVIGGLIQGIGWVTTEELVYGDAGELLSYSPTTYKIPNISDLPVDFRIDFVDNDLNRKNLRSTKAVGEPPLMLGLAVWAAIYDAVRAGRADGRAELALPATHEAILRALSRG